MRNKTKKLHYIEFKLFPIYHQILGIFLMKYEKIMKHSLVK